METDEQIKKRLIEKFIEIYRGYDNIELLEQLEDKSEIRDIIEDYVRTELNKLTINEIIEKM